MKWTLLTLVFFVNLCGTAWADPAQLMNQAIASYNQIDGKSQKERLVTFQGIVSNIESILSAFPGSNEARIILSKQQIGDFNPSRMKDEYIVELTDYYGKVCEVSPSYTCLAYISLRNGNDLCQNAKDYSDFDKAFLQLNNALNVFTSQSSNDGMSNLVVTTARQCTAGYDLPDWNADYYASILVEMLLDVGLEDNSRALIQEMKSPYFKFKGVLKLKEVSGEIADESYLSRLDAFIAENVGNNGDWNSPREAFLATVELRMFAVQHSNIKISRRYMRDAIQKYRNYGDDRNCDPEYANYLFNLMLDFQVTLASIPEGRNDLHGLDDLLSEFAIRPSAVYSTCGEQYSNYGLAADVHGMILAQKGVDQAREFRNLIKQRAMSSEEMITELFVRTDVSEPTLVSWYIKDAKYDGPDFAAMPVYKRLVDFGNVCDSSTLLFQNLALTDRFEEAVEYMLGSDAIDGSQKHSCGDEDLELMLK